jgi:CRP-like cAMP-binding protein
LLLEAYAGAALPDWGVFERSLQLARLAPGDVLMAPGEPHPYLYLVHSGLLRAQARTPLGHSSTIFFAEEGDILASMTALSPRAVHRVVNRELHPRVDDLRPALGALSQHTVSAVEQTTLVRSDFRIIAQMCWSVTAVYAMTLQADAVLARDAAEDRYRALRTERPNLVSRLTQRDLAAYLNVTEVTMSRIVKRVRLDPRIPALEPEPAALATGGLSPRR